MIQRIQTVFMFLALFGGVFLYVSSGDVVVQGITWLVQMGAIAVAVLTLWSIFSYQNRKKQLMLNKVSISLNALLIGILVYWLLNLPGGIEFPEKGIEPTFPILAIVCLAIANSYIRRDERLVKSVDRLR